MTYILDFQSIHETEIIMILTILVVEMVKINFDLKLLKSDGRN